MQLKMMFVFKSITVLMWLQLTAVRAQRQEGDSCVLATRPGTCRLLRDCAPLWNLLQNAGRPMPQNVRKVLVAASCGYSGSDPMVCCLPSGQPMPATVTAQLPRPLPCGGGGGTFRLPDVRRHRNLRLLPDNCGVFDDERITGGNRTAPFEFPWMVLVAYDTARGRRTSCGASLISARYVLTAAHCVSHLGTLTLAGVVVGEHDLRNEPDRDVDRLGVCVCAARGRRTSCGASLISARYVLTAAHCVSHLGTLTLAGVVVGEHDLRNDPDCERVEGELECRDSVLNITIEQAIPHSGYSPSNLHDDIALIRLAEPVDLTTDSVKAICLPRTPELQAVDLSSTNVVVAGWGATEDGLQSPVLLKVALPIVSTQRCQQIYNGSARIDERQVCAGGEREKDSCGGDSGGPLMYPGVLGASGLRYVQHGIVSFGHRRCGVGGYPGVYTRVAYYMDWILDHMTD